MVQEMFCQCAANPALKRRSLSVVCPLIVFLAEGNRILSGLGRGTVGSELVDRVSGAALAPAAANLRVPIMPGGHIAPNALRSLRRQSSRRPYGPVRVAVSRL